MFIDVRDFTAFAERTEPEDVVAAINGLFEQIVPIIHDHGGRVDKFVGDGLLAVFRRATAPGRSRPRGIRGRPGVRELESPEDLSIGVGLNSGPVIAGNVGGAGRLEFSVIGDAVNVAARAEAATRESGDAILLTERTKDLLEATHRDLEERVDVELKGKQEVVRVFAPVVG